MSRLEKIKERWKSGYWLTDDQEKADLRTDVNWLISEVQRLTTVLQTIRDGMLCASCSDDSLTIAALRAEREVLMQFLDTERELYAEVACKLEKVKRERDILGQMRPHEMDKHPA